MDHRRHIIRAVVTASAFLVVTGAALVVAPPPAGALTSVRTAAASVPHVGAERPASDLPALGKADPVAASDGSTTLVVWSDYLVGPVPQIRAARRNASGTVLGEFTVSASPAAQTSPSIAYNGTNFFVVWEENGDLFGTRVTPGGAVLDGYGIPVAISRADAYSTPAVASNGSDFLVSWIGRAPSDGDAVFAKRVTGGGTVLDGPGFLVGSAGLYGGITGGGPAVAFNGTAYLVVWISDDCPFCGTVLGSRVTPAGAVVNPGGFSISQDSAQQYFNKTAPSVSATGTQYVVAWTGERCTPPADCSETFASDALAGRVSSGGTVLGTSDIVVSSGAAAGDGFAGEVSVASTAATSLVVWSDGRTGQRDVYAARLSTGGVVTDSSGIRLSTAALADSKPVVTQSGSTFVTAWQIGVDIAGATLDEAGVVVHPGAVVSAGHAPGQSVPALAWNGSEVVSVWRESRVGLPDTIRVGRALPDGVPASGEGTVIASGFDLGDPAVSSSGQQQLVVWPQDGKIYGARLEFGNPIDPNPIVISPVRSDFSFPQGPAVAWNGTVYLVTWTDNDSGSLGVFGARVDPAGTVLDPTGITIASAPGDQDLSAVASDGSVFLVVWRDERNGTLGDIYGTRISAAATVSNPEGLPISTATGAQAYPAVAWNGTSYVVVWQDGRNAPTLDIYGTRLSAAGVVADPTGIAVSTAASDQSHPAVSALGSDTLIVWEDRRSGTGSDLYGARLTTAGVVSDAQGLVISNASTDEADPVMTPLGNGQVALGYQRLLAGPPYRADRVFVRLVAPK